ncbi:MAG: SDR family NAD(P)-dependent oxidoreductase [Phycisphaeraceae bacterium]
MTGASGGIGAATARRLAGRGYRVGLMGRNAAALDALAEAIGRDRAVVACAELAEPEACAAAVDALLTAHGPAAVLVNNAGAARYRPFLELDEDEHRRLVEVNYLGPARLTRQVLPGMLERGAGHVINVASMAARVGPWGHAGYAGAKAALVSLTQTLAAEYGGRGVHFCAVCPGIVDTPFFHGVEVEPLWRKMRRRAVSPERVARRIERLLDRPRARVCVPASYRALDWIDALSPGLAGRLVARQSRPGAPGRDG